MLFTPPPPSARARTHPHTVLGVLKGYDPLVNLVLDDTIEFLRDPEDAYRTTGATRRLGLVVARGTTVSMICPEDGHEEIANPFVQEG